MKKIFAFLALLILPLVACAQVYTTFAPGGDLSGTNTSQTIVAGAVTNAKLANSAADSIKCNATTSSATVQDCNPLAVAYLESSVLNVQYVATSNITLSGSQTVDGVVVPNGSSVLVAGQTTASQNGIYIANTAGAWSLAINFPSGYVIAANCNLAVHVSQGTNYAGATFVLNTSSPITIGTTAQTWTTESNIASTSSYSASTNVYSLGSANPSSTALTIQPPTSTTTSIGINIFAGSGNATQGQGGAVNIAAGGSYEGAGSGVGLTAGNAATQTSGNAVGGPVTLSAGSGVGSGNGGDLQVFVGTGGASGKLGRIRVTGPLLIAGTKFTVAGTGACATIGTTVGGVSSGTFTCTGTTGASTATVTIPIGTSTPTVHGFNCSWNDKTQATALGDSVGTNNTAVMSGSVTSGDVIGFNCVAY
jgi:hypothetical protein